MFFFDAPEEKILQIRFDALVVGGSGTAAAVAAHRHGAGAILLSQKSRRATQTRASRRQARQFCISQ